MSEQTVADYLLQRLRDWDIQHVFGFPGDGINGISLRGDASTTNRRSSRPATRR